MDTNENVRGPIDVVRIRSRDMMVGGAAFTLPLAPYSVTAIELRRSGGPVATDAGTDAGTAADVPATTRDVPMTAMDVPTTMRDVPMRAVDVPTTMRDVPITAVDVGEMEAPRSEVPGCGCAVVRDGGLPGRGAWLVGAWLLAAMFARRRT